MVRRRRGIHNDRCNVEEWTPDRAALKRGLSGTYVSVEPFHLFRYLDEQVFRFNNRATKENKVTDADRFDMIVRKLVGKRLTFAALTGKLCETSAF